MGLWHDLGKLREAFQVYLIKETQQKGSGGRVQHARDGAFLAAEKAVPRKILIGDMMAYAIAGHHAGLPDGIRLFGKFRGEQLAESSARWDECESKAPPVALDASALIEQWRDHAEQLKNRFKAGDRAGCSSFLGCPVGKEPSSCGFAVAMQIRMLFSALVDADYLATEAFMNPVQHARRPVWPPDALAAMGAVLEKRLHAVESRAAQGEINRLRAAIHRACFEAGGKKPGVFQLNVPTGGGKTLASLSFALEHARRHGLRRIIYVIPYTSIIDQTAGEFRKVFADLSAAWGHDCVLEHHSAVRSQKENGDSADEEDERMDRLRLLAENWDVPLVVTTSVQFFESLFSNRPSACRKLHRIARSVVIFDEAQTLPTHLLAPCLEAMKTLQQDYGSTLVLCTATQPALTQTPEFPHGWDEKELQSLLGREMELDLARRMKRVHVERLGELDRQQLVAHVLSRSEPSCLIIVNLTRQAQELFAALNDAGVPKERLFHLSARMCPEHREQVRADVDARLAAGEPVILVATRVVEAGVDLSFPVVYRDRAGLDSLAQAAGRCNRHGENPHGGRVFLFEAADYDIPAVLDDLKTAARCARDVLAVGGHDQDIFSPEAVRAFFESYYEERGRQTNWDKPGFPGSVPKILGETAISANGPEMFRGFSFAKVASSFHLIPPGQRRIMIPWGRRGEETLRQLESLPADHFPDRELYRRIQRLSVAVYENDWYVLQEKRLLEFFADDSVAVVPAYHEVYDADLGLLSLSSYDPNNKDHII